MKWKTVKRFRETGSVKDVPKSEPQKLETNDEKEDVLLRVTEKPKYLLLSLIMVPISKTSHQRALNKEHVHLYKTVLLQELSNDTKKSKRLGQNL